MATKILRPGAQGTWNEWYLGAGASKTAAVDTGDPVTHDDGTSWDGYDQPGLDPGGTYKDSYTLRADSIPPAIDVVSGITVGTRATCNAPASATARIYDWGVIRSGTWQAASSYSFTASFGWTTFGPNSCPRPGGGSWLPGDITTALQLAVRISIATDETLNTINDTSLWGVLTYIPPSGCYYHLVGSVVGPVVLPCLEDFLRALRHALRVQGIRLTREETLLAWREWRETRWRRYCLPGLMLAP